LNSLTKAQLQETTTTSNEQTQRKLTTLKEKRKQTEIDERIKITCPRIIMETRKASYAFIVTS
jgi:hypothetical protein